LGIFRLFNPTPILLEGDRRYEFSVEELRREVLGRGLAALLLSNPANPTGRTIAGAELAAWVASARALNCALLLDEFYSHYIWSHPDGEDVPIVSAAAFVEDVERDPVLIFDGLTKNWRYPGLRISWTIGPKSVIEAVASAGSFLDGGGNRPSQQAAISLLDDATIDAETASIRKCFAKKRSFLLDRLRGMGIHIDSPPDGGFYIWGSVENLSEGLDRDLSFFRAALAEKVITVPGQFFDINPGKRRQGRRSRFDTYLRFSFGPELDCLERACDRLEAIIAKG